MKESIYRSRRLFCVAVLVFATALLVFTLGKTDAVFAATPETITKSVGEGSLMGTHDGYDYEIWKDYAGTGTMVLKDGGTFSCNWSGIGNGLFRKGTKMFNKYGKNTYDKYGNITLEYASNYNISTTSYMCVYGWTIDPATSNRDQNQLVEYYIVDNYGGWKPPQGTSLNYNPSTGDGYYGQHQIGDGTYDIYIFTRVNKPSIDGTKTFKQYWSVRTDKRQSGTIGVNAHFEKWESLGFNLTGALYEVSFLIEAYSGSNDSSGSVNVTKNILSINAPSYTVDVTDGSYTPVSPTPGQTVTVTANAPTDYKQFSGWTVVSGGVTLSNVAGQPLKARFTMPYANVVLVANYAVPTEYDLTVNGGTYTGDPISGQVITLTADDPSEGKQFDGWTVVSGGATLSNVAGQPLKVRFTMPAANVEITANYSPTTYAVTTTDCTYSGNPQYGETITLTAEEKDGKEFDKWEVTDTGNSTAITVTDNKFIMPAANVTVTAVYKIVSSPLFSCSTNTSVSMLVSSLLSLGFAAFLLKMTGYYRINSTSL